MLGTELNGLGISKVWVWQTCAYGGSSLPVISPSQHSSRWRRYCQSSTDRVCRAASGQCAGDGRHWFFSSEKEEMFMTPFLERWLYSSAAASGSQWCLRGGLGTAISMELWNWGALSNYELLLRWAFLEWSLVAAVKSNFSIERHRVFRTWLPAVISFIERPFCWVLLIGYFLFTRESSCHDIQCFVGLFSRRDYLLYQLNHLLWCWMLVTKSMLTNEYAVSFWREPTEGSLLFRLVFSIFIYQT